MGLLERGAEAFEVMHDIEFAMVSYGISTSSEKDARFVREMQSRIRQDGRRSLVLKGELKWLRQIRDEMVSQQKNRTAAIARSR